MVLKEIKSFWNWLWKSESISSYVIFLVILFIIIKFVFLPGLSLIFGMGLNGLPLAIVESSSMDHHSLLESNSYVLCGYKFAEKKYYNLEEYWNVCGAWYEKNTNITQEQFSSFKFKNGFSKGDIIIIFGKKASNIQLGDVIIFQSGQPTPIIHRVISLNPLETKGDHNPDQLSKKNNYYLDETNIQANQVIGIAVARIPYLGWIKLFLVEHKVLGSIIFIAIIISIALLPSNKSQKV